MGLTHGVRLLLAEIDKREGQEQFLGAVREGPRTNAVAVRRLTYPASSLNCCTRASRSEVAVVGRLCRHSGATNVSVALTLVRFRPLISNSFSIAWLCTTVMQYWT
jgi:hypothetical protein